MSKNFPDKEINIVGAGIIAYLASYLISKSSLEKGQKIKINIFEKNHSINDTTVMHLVPSLTPDEMLAVIPPVDELLKDLQISFKEDHGIRVDDVPDIHKSKSTAEFLNQVRIDSALGNIDHLRHSQKILLDIGRRSMELWDEIYNEGDDEFKQIMIEANYNPCRRVRPDESKLHNGYRIDLIFKIKNAEEKAFFMAKNYRKIGFPNARVLTPKEVLKIDPFLKDFVLSNSVDHETWNDDASALWRPGGCINTATLLPKLHQYLSKKLGSFVDDKGQNHNYFQVNYGCEVKSVEISDNKITALNFVHQNENKRSENILDDAQYLFCPGEAVGTLKRLGFEQPADAGFAGASLILRIKIPQEKEAEFSSFSHYMEVHKNGVVFAWQGKYLPDKKEILLGIAGSKAFYADISPKSDEEFCRDRNLLQLNVVNQIVPDLVSLAFGRDTKEKDLNYDDLKLLEDQKIAERWVGIRAFAYDGMPTVGTLWQINGEEISNAKTINHAGSGGVSYGPALVEILQKLYDNQDVGEYFNLLNPNRVAILQREMNMRDLVSITPENGFDVVLDIRYATADNFVGEAVYDQNYAMLHPKAASCLRKAIKSAKELGFGVKIFDAFRPFKVQEFLFSKFPNGNYVSDPKTGLITHCRGIAVDITLLDKDGKELEMGTGFDDFSPKAHHGSEGLTEEEKQNRAILLKIMQDAGFELYKYEWWHYQLPNPREYAVVEC